MQRNKLIESEADAEHRFQLAFERVCSGKTRIIPRGSKVTQANVALEAGVDPSALRKSRFPNLVAAIQQYKQLKNSGVVGSSKSTARRSNCTEVNKLRAENQILRERAALETSKLISLYSEFVALQSDFDALKAGVESGKVKFLKPKED